MNQVLEETRTSDTDNFDDTLNHYFCGACDPEGTIAFCGTLLKSGDEWVEEDEIDCVVCLDIYDCPRCGDSGE